MINLKVVTGYVPIQGHPRTAKEYGALGEAFFGKLQGVPITPYYETIGECWLWKYINGFPGRLSWSVADNPAKNSPAYHCVQHQKFAWLLKAAIADPSRDTYVWLDYGIGHVPGCTVEAARDFLDRVVRDDFAIPGCWPLEHAFNTDSFPCWRFCGGVMVVPRHKVHRLYKLVKREVLRHIAETKNLVWEVNTLARIEATLGVRWYQADHNETMFTGYSHE